MPGQAGNGGVDFATSAIAIDSTGSASIMVTGTAGNGTMSCSDIDINTAGSGIRTNTGVMTLTGNKAITTTTTDNHGVLVGSGADILSTATGAISITEIGGAGTQNNHGIRFTGAGTTLNTSGGGNVTLMGTGGAGSTTTNNGVAFDSDATLVLTGAGTNFGANISSITAPFTVITIGNSDATIRGTANSATTLDNNNGIYFTI